MSNQNKFNEEIKSESENKLIIDEKIFYHINNIRERKNFTKISKIISIVSNEVKKNYFKKRSDTYLLKFDDSIGLPDFKEINQILINICSNKININRRKEAIKKLLELDALTVIYCEEFKIFMNSINIIFQEKLLQESILKFFTWICNSEEFHLIYNCIVFLLNEVQINIEWWGNPRNNNIILFHKLLYSLLINVPEIWKFLKQHKVENICYLFRKYYKLWPDRCVIIFIYAYLDNNTGIWKRFLSTSIFWKNVNIDEEKAFFDKFISLDENLNINDFFFIIKSKTIHQDKIKNMIKNYKFEIFNIFNSFFNIDENNK
ncbi:Hypothetical protein SRAE_2000227350 [Strongyloides ratti]|uniref:Uncharacterized protein n=1 Tax=Strongyloides ratti TaxID=34506 RepID=A0A090LCY0_STRRB|nr:Hypothetical protein SRAE_2000227350 [Strongyloides ratti]CEF67612.1 Hypothetical protein SRAE_2000227350 [Strongyloides ratti]